MGKNDLKKKFLHAHLGPDHKQSAINSILSLQRKNDIIAMLLEGKESKEVRKYLMTKYGHTSGSANILISGARKEIKKRRNFEIGTLIAMHIHRYEQIYAELYKMKAQNASIDALRAKEKLLGFHKEGFHMKVTKGEIQAVQLQTVDSEYDVMKLSEEQTRRLEFLLNKAKRKREPQGTTDATVID
jgi:hypothetical protein